MENISVQKRDFTVKAKKLRRSGIVPGIVFGSSLPESISIQIHENAARNLVRRKREGSRLSLDVEGQTIPVQIKEKSLDTISNQILHLSFQVLNEDEKVNSVVHIFTTNDDKSGGLVERMLTEIPYASLPDDMIDTITIDADGLKAGDVLRVRDIPDLMSETIELQVDTDEMVVRVNERRHLGEIPMEEIY